MPESRQSAVRLGYRPALDGVRAVAIAPVVALHAFGWPSEGSLGVDLFFVLSGFLITVLLLEERATTGAISLRNFWRRRAARLVPALLVMLAIYTVATGGAHAWAVVLGATYLSNLANAANLVPIPWSLGHLWSLAQEEQFYLIWPLVLLAVMKLRPRVLTRVIAAVVMAVFLEQLALIASGASWQRLYFAPDVHSQPIIIGCLVGSLFASAGLPRVLRQHERVIGPALLGLVLAMVALPFAWSPFTAANPLRLCFALTCAGLVLVAAGGTIGLRALALPPVVYLGRISYSVYLWHVPVLAAIAGRPGEASAAGTVLALVLGLGMAAVSFHVVERPLRRRLAMPRPSQRAQALPTPATVAPRAGV
jgi:peptidoglycan/LPS O-acetylase OafA/YrhL